PAQGSRVELTLDAGIQDVTERELAAGVAAAKAAGGAALVLDPPTSEVLPLANVPAFDPKQPGRRHDRGWRDRVRNRAITDPYEPGSTFKAMLAAAAIEERVVKPTDMFFCENGRYQVGRWRIHDAHRHGWLSFAQVIQYSSNIGATKVAERLGAERYYRYLRAFGFGARTGIELPGETPGILRPVERWARIDLATHSFGQGVSVTPLQMAVAFAAIANGGLLVRPYLVRRVLTPEGDVVLANEPAVVRRVVSARTAGTVLKRLGVESPALPLQMASAPAGRAPRKTPALARSARTATAPAEPSTPSFLGLWRREALTRAYAAGWDVQVSGIGYVSEQSPPPGAPLVPERRLALRLVPGPGTASP